MALAAIFIGVLFVVFVWSVELRILGSRHCKCCYYCFDLSDHDAFGLDCLYIILKSHQFTCIKLMIY